jgi:FSR family fosmidomycin resistance protein-like MFS transporter
MRHRYLGLLTAGHLVTDVNQGAVAALLPFLIEEHGISYAAAAGLMFAMSMTSSIAQPLFGHFSDRLSKPWLMPAGILLAGLGVTFTGIAPRYWLIFLSIAISGIGVAAFHPEAARLANAVSGERKATGMSVFAVGGNAGFALGPMFTTYSLLLWGLKGTLMLIVPVVIMVIAILRYLSHLEAYQMNPTKKGSDSVVKMEDEWGPFARLTGVIACRSIIFYGLNTFIPLYWIRVLNQSKAVGGTALTILFSAGVVGTLIGGRLADNYGYRRIIRGGFAVLIFLFILFVESQNVTLATSLLIPIGLAFSASYSPTVVLGQKYLPNRIGFASGVTLGLAVSVGGVAAPLLGWFADHYGLRAVFTGIAALPILGTAIAFTLPRPQIDGMK